MKGGGGELKHPFWLNNAAFYSQGWALSPLTAGWRGEEGREGEREARAGWRERASEALFPSREEVIPQATLIY